MPKRSSKPSLAMEVTKKKSKTDFFPFVLHAASRISLQSSSLQRFALNLLRTFEDFPPPLSHRQISQLEFAEWQRQRAIADAEWDAENGDRYEDSDASDVGEDDAESDVEDEEEEEEEDGEGEAEGLRFPHQTALTCLD